MPKQRTISMDLQRTAGKESARASQMQSTDSTRKSKWATRLQYTRMVCKSFLMPFK